MFVVTNDKWIDKRAILSCLHNHPMTILNQRYLRDRVMLIFYLSIYTVLSYGANSHKDWSVSSKYIAIAKLLIAKIANCYSSDKVHPVMEPRQQTARER